MTSDLKNTQLVTQNKRNAGLSATFDGFNFD